MKLKTWLVFRASDASLRCVKRQPSLSWDEIAWVIDLNVPPPWGRLVGSITIDLPAAPEPTAEVVLLEQP